MNILYAMVLFFYFNILSLAQINFENEKEKIIERISELIDSNYVIKERAKEYSYLLRKSHKNGIFDSCNTLRQFTISLNKELLNITGDKHNSLRIIDPKKIESETISSLYHPIRFLNLAQKENYGFYNLEYWEGNVGYLDFRRFYFPTDAKNILEGAINFLSESNAIIIDLRKNQGGSLEMLPIISSYFLDPSTQLNSVYYRANDFTREFWTNNNIITDKLRNVPLFLLVGDGTFSAAEYFSYDMQSLNRAVIIGETTRGGANSVDLFKVNNSLELYLSTAMAVNPVTKTNWEGIGVIPDIIISEENLLDSTKVLAQNAGNEYSKNKNIKRDLLFISMQQNLDNADSLYKIGMDDFAIIKIDSAFNKIIREILINEFFFQVLIYHYASLENHKMYLAIINEYLKVYPNSYYPYENLAMYYEDENNSNLAIKNFEKVLDLYPQHSTAKKKILELKKK